MKAPSRVDPAAVVPVGRVTKPHGVRGEVRVELYGRGELLLTQRRVLVAGAPRDVASARRAQDGWALLRFDGVADRDEAERLRGAELALPRDVFPPAGDDEVWHHEVIGAEVFDRAGQRTLGLARAIVNYGASDLLVVDGPDGEWMLPWIDDVILSIDPGEADRPGRVDVAVPEGLEPTPR